MKSPGIFSRLASRAAVSLAVVALSLFCAAIPAQAPQKADSILILKKDHALELLAGGKVVRTYKVALGQGGLARKVRQPVVSSLPHPLRLRRKALAQ